MAYWLLKTEPSTYSFDDLVKDGRTRWDGITNPVAIKNLRTAVAGDVAIVYHTGGERAAIGTAHILGGAYADPDKGNPKLQVIDLAAGDRFAKPVTLEAMKSEPAFEGSPLVRQGRLSFVPITDAQWKTIQRLSR